MKNKKYLAWIFSGESMNKTLTVHSFLINRLCENFEKIYFINMDKFKLSKDWQSYKREFSYKVDNKFKVPNNIEIIIPKTIKDFEDFMIGKELIAINDLGRFFSDLKIHFLLARYKIKHIQIQNIGFYTQSPKSYYSFWKNIYQLQKYYSHKLIVLLSNLGLVSKIQIRFTSNVEIIKIINKSFIRKILNKLNFFYVKEFIIINSRSFDIFKKQKAEVSEDKIVFVDYNLNHPEVVAFQGNLDPKNIEKHYYYLNKIINYFSDVYNKKAIICIHPSDNLDLKKKYFPSLEVVKYQTMQNIYKAFLVLYIDSSAITDAILLKKRILAIISKFSGKMVVNHSLWSANRTGIMKINIEDKTMIDKEKFLSELDNAKKNYSNYIKSYLAPDGDNVGYEKMIKVLKERFF